MADKQFWSGDNSRRITQRIIVEGDLVLQTPALFGTGDHDLITDMPLLVDGYDGVTPVLTGASLTGALRAYLGAREVGYLQPDKVIANSANKLTEALFGGFKGDDDGLQSAVIVDDAYGINFGMETRDGVRIDPQTRTASNQELFNMQAWQAGTIFPLRFELLLAQPRHKMGKNYHQRLKQGLAIALEGLTDGAITLGGRKKRGYGRFTTQNWRIKPYDLTTAAGLCDWLKNGHKPLADQQIESLEKPTQHPVFDFGSLIDHRHRFRMEAEFALDSSLLVRSAGRPNSNSPDMVHLSNNKGEPIISGTSITGALRSRTHRILNLFHDEKTTRQRINDLFGVFGKDLRDTDNPSASRLLVEETIIEEPQFELVQNRVAIDRFTGGAKDSALFNEQPVFGRNNGKTRLHVNLTIHNPKPQDIGLMLLLLKDLWMGDLALGGEASVGRGRLRGQIVHMQYRHYENQQWQTENWQIANDNGQLSLTGATPDHLEQFVAAVHTGEAA